MNKKNKQTRQKKKKRDQMRMHLSNAGKMSPSSGANIDGHTSPGARPESRPRMSSGMGPPFAGGAARELPGRRLAGTDSKLSYHFESSSNTRQLFNPGRVLKLRSGSRTETTRTVSSLLSGFLEENWKQLHCTRRSTAATTASFSTGLREHVEYTRRPRGASSFRPRVKIAACNRCTRNAFNGVHEGMNGDGSLRTVPSPLQGTSHIMRSNDSGTG